MRTTNVVEFPVAAVRRLASTVPPRPARRPGSSAKSSHLLVAADVLNEGYQGSIQIAVCGAEVQPGSGAAVGSDEDPGYCRGCVRAAVRWNARRAGR